MPPVVSRSRGDFGQIHCLLSRAANAFHSGQFCLVLRFWRLAKPITYVFSTNWLQEIIEALFSMRLRRMSLERGFSVR